jgi:hypothetical protein
MKNKRAFQEGNYTHYYKMTDCRIKVFSKKMPKGEESVFLDPNTFGRRNIIVSGVYFLPKTVQKSCLRISEGGSD